MGRAAQQPAGAQPGEGESQDRDEPLVLETPIGDFVGYPGDAPYIQFLLFRSDHDQAVAEVEAHRAAGEMLDSQEAFRRTRNYGALMVSIDEQGFSADLYLDREIVEPDEVETLVDGVGDFLEGMPIGPEGGALSVYWMEEIAHYSFEVEEE